MLLRFANILKRPSQQIHAASSLVAGVSRSRMNLSHSFTRYMSAESEGAARMKALHLDPSMGIVLEQLLRTVGTDRDVEQYLNLYGKLDSQKFAVIKVGGEVIQKELDTFACALTFLHRAGLFPIVVHGAGPQMNDVLNKEGYEPTYRGGMRVTDEYTLKVARRVFLETNLELVDRLQSLRTPARPITSGVFEAEQLDPHLGYVGDIKKVHKHAILASIQAGCLPIIGPLAESSSGQILNINADVAAREVALAFQPHKTIMINAKGGWIEPDGTKLRNISMEHDYERLRDRDYTGRQGTLLKLNELKQMLDNLHGEASIALTSPSGLVNELFTHRGKGTLVTRGERIEVHKSIDAAGGYPFLHFLSEQGFGHNMFDQAEQSKGHLNSNYMDLLADPVGPSPLEQIYTTSSKSAAAIVRKGVNCNGVSIPYLCKFAVTEAGISNGTSTALWNRITTDYPNFYWRSHAMSSSNSWFFERARGSIRVEGVDPCIVFWHSDDKLPHAAVDEMVKKSLQAPRSYVSKKEFADLKK